VKRLGLFLLAAFLAFFAAYAASDTRMFFGGGGPGPTPGQSERPAVEAALSRLDAAMARYYQDGDEGPARQALAAPDDPASPLHEWRLDRAAWSGRGEVPVAILLERRLGPVSLSGLDTVSATATETWETPQGGAAPPLRATLTVRYTLARAPEGLLVSSVQVQP